MEGQILYINVQRFRGGLAFKAHRLFHRSTLGLCVIEKKRRRQVGGVTAARRSVETVLLSVFMYSLLKRLYRTDEDPCANARWLYILPGGKMRVCRLWAAKLRRGAGLCFFSRLLRSSAFPGETCQSSSLSRVGGEVAAHGRGPL